ncbi:GNAT family N-acetyltransferase [Litchfieldia salsa]|uniref:Acetyltransferase (GNAT) domain-containing protein n=1 Tax=Litchfieldia salsa TaxID=930152 RepID=A0A1H0T0X7_9BACI|nr:GNAT family N-acetyltransferase [Litchfieldia salsa]SDP47451.1 Acetyltransferase (GNAT) domain-containing protein [Litchfieldia salsa]
MTGLSLYKDYKNNDELRKSFNDLATLVFGLNFEEWYKKGYWNDRYIPFSYVAGTKVIANVSVNILKLVINGEIKKAIQIGTVMTHPDYRGKGLSSSLMNMVMEEYEDSYDFIYLVANPNVLEFYPKFGFHPVNEYRYSLSYSPKTSGTSNIRKLDGGNIEDLEFIYNVASERVPVSNLFGTQDTQGILMFYCIYVFKSDIYFLENEDAIVIFKANENQVDIFDIISQKEVIIENVLSEITSATTKKIVFHYTPNYKGMNVHNEVLNSDDVLFIKAKGNNHFPLRVKHPITSQA